MTDYVEAFRANLPAGITFDATLNRYYANEKPFPNEWEVVRYIDYIAKFGFVSFDPTGLSLVPDYWIDATNGSDLNAGTSEGAAFATLSVIDESILTADADIVVRVKSDTYATDDDRIDYTLISKSNAGLIVVFEAGCVIDGSAYTTSQPVISGGSNVAGHTQVFYGNGLIVRDNTTAVGNGLSATTDIVSTYYNIDCINNTDNISSKNTATMNLYDVTTSGAVKGEVNQGADTITNCYRCSFTAAASNIGTEFFLAPNGTGSFAAFNTKFIGSASENTINIPNGVLTNCQLGTTSLRLIANNLEAPLYIIDSFVNVYSDGQNSISMDRCYGYFTTRIRSGGSVSLSNCVISGPASTQSSIFFSNFQSGAAQDLVITDNIFETASAAEFMNINATNAGYIVTAAGQFFNNILSGSAAFDTDLIAADTGGTVIVDNVTADALIGAANTLDPDDYGYGAGSPAIGAATDGGNSGFAIGEVAAPNT